MSIKADNVNKAIVRKLERVLENTDSICDLKVTIQGHRGEAPMITYEISEFIAEEGNT